MACGLDGRGPEAAYAKGRAPLISFEALQDMSATPIRSKSAKPVKAQKLPKFESERTSEQY
jgi:hypothetical protein